jgi:hypothetical protein
MEIALALCVPLKRAHKILAKIEAEEKAAQVTTDPKILAQWVKAQAGGMPIEEIARSFKAPVADVAGALAGKGAAKRKTKAAKKAAKKGGVK